MQYRTGIGFDVHQLQEGVPFILGGVEISHSKGPIGHSDADVLLHAISDALLGAAALGDIGQHFPDDDPAYKDIDSQQLLQQVVQLLQKDGYTISNIDSVIALQAPKIKPYISKIRETIASTIDISPEQVSVKATTTEEMGFIGREEGIMAYATALIYT
jgi:2-C-methyl-D-erythritol 2,4-cyclodiphosphate synthase